MSSSLSEQDHEALSIGALASGWIMVFVHNFQRLASGYWPVCLRVRTLDDETGAVGGELYLDMIMTIHISHLSIL